MNIETNLLISKNEKYLNYTKWNNLIFNIQKADEIFHSCLDSYRGNYNPSIEYKKYETVWKAGCLCEINGDKLLTVSEAEKPIGSSFILDYGVLYYLDDNKILKKQVNNATTQILSTQIDSFKIFETKILANRGQRIFEIEDNKLTPINISFTGQLVDYTADENYIFYIENDQLKYGNIFNKDNTVYEQLEIGYGCLKISNSTNYIFVIDNKNNIKIVNKLAKKITTVQLDIQNVDLYKLKLLSPNDNTLIIYTGSQLLSYYHINGNLKKIISKEIENEINFSNENITNIGKDKIYELCGTKEYLSPVDFSNLFIVGADIHIKNLEVGLDYIKSQFEHEKASLTQISGEKTDMYSGLILDQKELKYKINTDLIGKSILLKLNTYNEINQLGYIITNNKKVIINGLKVSGKINLLLNFFDDYVEIFIYQNGKFIGVKEKPFQESLGNELVISSAKSELLQILIFTTTFLKKESDFICKNNVVVSPSSINNNKPFSLTAANKDGNVFIQQATATIKGITYLSDDYNSNLKDAALSLKGAQGFLEKIKTLLSKLEGSCAKLIHRHNWNEIDNIPNATDTQKGVVYLTSDVNDISDNKAASAKYVNDVKKIAERPQPYLNINTGGTVKGYTTFTNGFALSGEKGLINSDLLINGKMTSNNTLTVNNEVNVQKNIHCNSNIIARQQLISEGISSNDIEARNIKTTHLTINGYKFFIGE